VDSLLVTVAHFSEIAMYVFILLFVAVLLAMCIYVYRGGKVEPEEGHVVTENRALTANDSVSMGGSGVSGGRYWGKHKVLTSRSMFITDMSLVDGTATNAQRLLVRGMKLGAMLFWLAWVCGGLALLPTQPIFAIFITLFLTAIFIQSVRLVRKGRADALRKLQEIQASRQNHPRHIA
jgi:hypothetical protein